VPVAKGSRGTECLPFKDISRPSGTASTLPLWPSKVDKEEKEEDAEKEYGIVFSSEKYLFHPPKKIRPHPTQSPTTPSPRSPICRRLSFEIKPFKKTETFQEEGEENLKPSFPF